MEYLWYISKVHLNFSQEEFLQASFGEIYTLWMYHIRFHGWGFKKEEKQEKKQMSIDEISFL